ncbi:MAG: hypothetical protein MJH11_17135 [Lentisphaeria bacterium]|nr:hypothetical protein [Lentisphaeria bacterium]
MSTMVYKRLSIDTKTFILGLQDKADLKSDDLETLENQLFLLKSNSESVDVRSLCNCCISLLNVMHPFFKGDDYVVPSKHSF